MGVLRPELLHATCTSRRSVGRDDLRRHLYSKNSAGAAAREQKMNDASVAVGERFSVPASFFDEEGDAFMATVRCADAMNVTFHCDGDPLREVTSCPIDEFLSDCSRLAAGEATIEAKPSDKADACPGCNRVFATSGGLAVHRRRTLCGSTPHSTVSSSREAELEPTCCEKDPRCVRGYKHGGFGGMCSLRKMVSTQAAGKAASSLLSKSSKAPLLVIPDAEPKPLKRHRIVRLPNPEDDKVGKRIKLLFDGPRRWETAEILEVVPCIEGDQKYKPEYVLWYHKDGREKQEDLEKFEWQWLQAGDPVDAYKGGGPEPGVPESTRAHPLPPPPPPPTRVEKKRKPSAAASAAVHPERRRTNARFSPHTAVSRLVADAIQCILARARDAAAASADDLPVMRDLRSIEWFAGSARLTFALRQQHHWHAVVHDMNPDAVEWGALHAEAERTAGLFRSDEFLEEVRPLAFCHEAPYDYFHFSIDCCSFSTLGHAGQGRNEENDFLGEGTRCEEGNRMFQKTIKLIEDQLDRNPNFLFTIENPFTGKMKDHAMVRAKLEVSRSDGGLGATRCVIDYCWFYEGVDGRLPFHKRTIVWTNSPTLIRELGPHAPPVTSSHYLCERATPCPHYGWHRPVAGNTALATPFPKPLAARIARAITLDASAQRWRPQKA